MRLRRVKERRAEPSPVKLRVIERDAPEDVRGRDPRAVGRRNDREGAARAGDVARGPVAAPQQKPRRRLGRVRGRVRYRYDGPVVEEGRPRDEPAAARPADVNDRVQCE